VLGHGRDLKFTHELLWKKSADGCDENQALCDYNKLSKKHFRVVLQARVLN